MGEVLIFDGHNDVVSKLLNDERHAQVRLIATGQASPPRDFFARGDGGQHIDRVRAQEGGFAGGLFSIYVAADPDAPPPTGPVLPGPEGLQVRQARPISLAFAQRRSLAQLGLLYRLQRQSAGQLRIVRSVADIQDCLRSGALAAVVHFEGAEAIDPGLDALEVFYQAGLRSLGPVWSRPNIFAEGVPFRYPHSPDTGPGLTEAGKDLVRACNELGIMLDLSHLNEQGFWDVARLSNAPLVATHSNAHTISPSTRNLTDKQLAAIKESEGLVGLNFSVGDLRQDGRNDPDLPLAKVVDHIDYLVEQLGIDCIALGTDFDGTRVPLEIGDVTGLPGLVQALRERGYDEEALHKLAYQNWIRVLSKTWK